MSITTQAIKILIFSFACLGAKEPPQASDPYPGSGGVMLGTPSDKEIASGKLDFTPKLFDSLKIGSTYKSEVVKILDKPRAWKTDQAGKSRLEYDYIETPGFMGMRKIMYTFFDFNSKLILTRISYPGYDSKISPITFNNKLFVGRSVAGGYEFSPKSDEAEMLKPELITINITPLNKPNQPNSLEAVEKRAADRYQGKWRILPQLIDGGPSNQITAVRDYPSYSEFVAGHFFQVGTTVIEIDYSRRIRHKKNPAGMDSWIQQNRSNIEKLLTNFEPDSVKNLFEE